MEGSANPATQSSSSSRPTSSLTAAPPATIAAAVMVESSQSGVISQPNTMTPTNTADAGREAVSTENLVHPRLLSFLQRDPSFFTPWNRVPFAEDNPRSPQRETPMIRPSSTNIDRLMAGVPMNSFSMHLLCPWCQQSPTELTGSGSIKPCVRCLHKIHRTEMRPAYYRSS